LIAVFTSPQLTEKIQNLQAVQKWRDARKRKNPGRVVYLAYISGLDFSADAADCCFYFTTTN